MKKNKLGRPFIYGKEHLKNYGFKLSKKHVDYLKKLDPVMSKALRELLDKLIQKKN